MALAAGGKHPASGAQWAQLQVTSDGAFASATASACTSARACAKVPTQPTLVLEVRNWKEEATYPSPQTPYHLPCPHSSTLLCPCMCQSRP